VSGPERVSELGGGFAQQIAIAEQYLAPFGDEVRDRVMFHNAVVLPADVVAFVRYAPHRGS
jgi:hypothetical protein